LFLAHQQGWHYQPAGQFLQLGFVFFLVLECVGDAALVKKSLGVFARITTFGKGEQDYRIFAGCLVGRVGLRSSFLLWCGFFRC